MNSEVIIIGAGAAGLMTAVTAARRGRRVLVLEHNGRVGNKILISGGGRCNFTNYLATPDNYLSGNPDFCKSALARFKPQQFIDWVEQHGISYHEKKLGQLFCDESSRQITGLLMQDCADAGVEILVNTKVTGVESAPAGEGTARLIVQTDKGPMSCESVVVATGGLSFPKLGANDIGYRIAKSFGLNVTPVRPGLVPLTFSPRDVKAYGELSGISMDVVVSCAGRRFRENILFTHRGLSGPAILQISSYWKESQSLTIDLSPDEKLEEWLVSKQSERTELVNVLGLRLPKRFVQAWCARDCPSKPINQFSIKKLREIAQTLHRWEIFPAGTEGYSKAEVTLGGVDTGELSSKTMEAKRVPGLFFVGEVVDVTGHLGGFNFQWAWASGAAAGGSA